MRIFILGAVLLMHILSIAQTKHLIAKEENNLFFTNKNISTGLLTTYNSNLLLIKNEDSITITYKVNGGIVNDSNKVNLYLCKKISKYKFAIACNLLEIVQFGEYIIKFKSLLQTKEIFILDIKRSDPFGLLYYIK